MINNRLFYSRFLNQNIFLFSSFLIGKYSEHVSNRIWILKESRYFAWKKIRRTKRFKNFKVKKSKNAIEQKARRGRTWWVGQKWTCRILYNMNHSVWNRHQLRRLTIGSKSTDCRRKEEYWNDRWRYDILFLRSWSQILKPKESNLISLKISDP